MTLAGPLRHGVEAPPILPPPPVVYRPLLEAALREDLGSAGDITTDAVVPQGASAIGRLMMRGAGTVAGLPVCLEVFTLLNHDVEIEVRHSDGESVGAGTVVAVVKGSARAILTAERTALNLFGRLAGVATLTRQFVDAVADHPARIVATRKTTPGLRALEKYAVRVGGGLPHRYGLYDAFLIKDNHIALAGGVGVAIARAVESAGHMVVIEVEVDTLAQLDEALAAGARAVLLDNMSLEDMARAVVLARGRAATEASGGVTLESVAAVAATGVDYISVGQLTHSPPSVDVALDVSVAR